MSQTAASTREEVRDLVRMGLELFEESWSWADLPPAVVRMLSVMEGFRAQVEGFAGEAELEATLRRLEQLLDATRMFWETQVSALTWHRLVRLRTALEAHRTPEVGWPVQEEELAEIGE